MNPRAKAVIKETLETLITAVVLASLIRAFVIQPFKIPTGSMEPTLMPHDRILVLRYAYGLRWPFTFRWIVKFKEPQRGDIVVFNYPEDTKRAFIKRCVGLPGEDLEIKNGEIYVDGKPVFSPPINSVYYYNRGEYALEDEVVKIPEDGLFVLGDNSASSRDSRYWGFLDKDYLMGKAILIYWPLNRIRMLK